MERLGIYIHIPFCIRKCAYCDFYSLEDTGRRGAYVDALVYQIKSFRGVAANSLVDSIYIGGGTPSVLFGEDIQRILAAVRFSFHVSDEAEITIETNPGTLDTSKLSAYREAGINRLSIGLQSADNRELRQLSRIHTREEFESSFLLARLEGFENINVDVMYALPGQSEETLASTIDYVLALEPEHISFYGLKIEPGTPLDGDPQIAAAIPSEDKQYEMYLASAKKLEAAGYMQYEISNFAKLGMECRHNLNVWRGGRLRGFGPSAAGFDGLEIFGIDYKVAVTITQIIGYLIAKFAGIKIISELKRPRRLAFIASMACASSSPSALTVIASPHLTPSPITLIMRRTSADLPSFSISILLENFFASLASTPAGRAWIPISS